MINERARSLARKPRKKKVELQGTTASWSSVGVISCTRLLCIVLCWVEWRNWPVVLLMMIMMMMIKVLRWSLLLQQCDQPAAACVVIICVSEVSASVWHTLQRPISCLRDKGGKGREVGKGRREGKRRAGFSGLSSVDNLVRRFTRCPRQTTPVLSPDARSSIHVSSSSSSIPAHPSTVSRDQSFFFHLFHFENLAEFNPKKGKKRSKISPQKKLKGKKMFIHSQERMIKRGEKKCLAPNHVKVILKDCYKSLSTKY